MTCGKNRTDPIEADPAAIADALGTWYAANARALPWRADPTPYRVLLSELMLQQTRVETVLPYFARFVRRWPTLADLAAADEVEVLEEWAGLGYYSRARNLHRCARAAARGLPPTAAELALLPGIGPYTAGAIASIAFGEAAALVDGNVERLLSRLDGRDLDPRSKEGKRALWARAGELQRSRGALRPGDLNQALMEMGATVCVPRKPRCHTCPLAGPCAARASGTPERWPTPTRKAPVAAIRGAAGVFETAAGRLLGRRVAGGLLGGLWEPIRVEIGELTEPGPALVAGFAALGLTVRLGTRRPDVVHVFTHRRLTCAVFEVAQLVGEPVPAPPYEEVAFRGDLRGLSTLARKILEA